MKVEIKVLPEAKEPYAVIYASEITPEIRRTAALLETKNSGVVSVMENERIIVLRPDEIYMVRVENEKTVVYTKTKRYDGGKRLYEFEEILGKGFMRISKGTLANLHYLDYVESTLGGLMLLVLKNGCKECISRKYLPDFKKYLGLSTSIIPGHLKRVVFTFVLAIKSAAFIYYGLFLTYILSILPLISLIS